MSFEAIYIGLITTNRYSHNIKPSLKKLGENLGNNYTFKKILRTYSKKVKYEGKNSCKGGEGVGGEGTSPYIPLLKERELKEMAGRE